jgi:hypothetical protein
MVSRTGQRSRWLNATHPDRKFQWPNLVFQPLKKIKGCNLVRRSSQALRFEQVKASGEAPGGSNHNGPARYESFDNRSILVDLILLIASEFSSIWTVAKIHLQYIIWSANLLTRLDRLSVGAKQKLAEKDVMVQLWHQLELNLDPSFQLRYL